jgi:hypothetical protein
LGHQNLRSLKLFFQNADAWIPAPFSGAAGADDEQGRPPMVSEQTDFGEGHPTGSLNRFSKIPIAGLAQIPTQQAVPFAI